MDNPTHYDAIIIGSGQAGNPLAQLLDKKGWKIALVEKGYLGGTCVNTGCTPTKTYVASARAAWMVANSRDLGVEIDHSAKINLSAIKSRKDKLVNQSRSGIQKFIDKSSNITLIKYKASFVGEKTLKVGLEFITAEKIFINVGARAMIPEAFAEIEHLTNASILQLEEIPRHLIILGGSYIGLEFAQIFKRFGSKVTILETSKTLISKEDIDTSNLVKDILEKEKIKVFCSVKNVNPKNKKAGEVEISFTVDSKNKKIQGSHLLVATGRIPNSDLLNPSKSGIKLDDRGYFKVNSTLETNISGIYALGDCNGEGAFTHTSYNDFEIIENQLFGDKKKSLHDRVINYALYTDPPLGRVGMTVSQAKQSGKNILLAQMPMSEISRAKEKGETFGKMEVIVDADSELILGASVLGTGGDEIIGTFITAIYGKMNYKKLINSVQTHPTVTELIPTLLQKVKPLLD